MAKVIDITEKMNFEEAPKLRIKDEEISVNSDAPTMLRVMQKLGSGDNITPADIVDMYEMLIPEGGRKKLDEMKLSFEDFQTVVKAAISVVTGSDLDEVGQKEQ